MPLESETLIIDRPVDVVFEASPLTIAGNHVASTDEDIVTKHNTWDGQTAKAYGCTVLIVDGIVVDLATRGIRIGGKEINTTASVVLDAVVVTNVVADDVVLSSSLPHCC